LGNPGTARNSFNRNAVATGPYLFNLRFHRWRNRVAVDPTGQVFPGLPKAATLGFVTEPLRGKASSGQLKQPQTKRPKHANPFAAMEPEVIYDSPPSNLDDDLWLAHGAKMLEDSVPAIRTAATELIKALGMLMTAYLAILGFAKFIPESMEAYNKALFVVPIVPWVFAIYYGLRVLKTDLHSINLNSPSDIKEKAAALLETKQRHLDTAFALLIAGIVVAFALIVFRIRI
jgi:hypothetical protein